MSTSISYTKRKRRHRKFRSRFSGTAKRPRLVVFKSLRYHTAQLVNDEKNQIIAQASDIKESKGSATERAKKVGSEIAKKAKEKKIDNCIFDRNGFIYHGRVKAIADAARENGLNF